MSVDRRWGASSIARLRILAVGLILILAGCAILALGSRRQFVVYPALGPSSGQSALGVPGGANESEGRAGSLLAGLPLFFEPNEGQGALDPVDPRARFVNRGSGYSLFLGKEGAILSLTSQVRQKSPTVSEKPPGVVAEFLQMKLVGANHNVTLRPLQPVAGKSNYFIGNDPAQWRRGIPHFAQVRYDGVYPGIDLVFYGKQEHLEYDFRVAPGADPSQTQFEFDGARDIELKDGQLIIKGEHGSVRLESPHVYQEIAGKILPVEASFVLRGAKRAGFQIASYDRSRELIIDPTLNFSTYFGGSGDEHSTSVAVDGSLNIYLTGSTTSANLPVTACSYTGCGTLNGAQNVYIAKITPPLGSVAALLDNVTYLGGNGTDTPAGIKVDGAGNPFVAGTTSSTNFPTSGSNAYQTAPLAGSPGPHVFVTKLSLDFSHLIYSSYLSGNGSETATGMTIDPAGHVYLTGITTSNNVANTSAGIEFPASTLPEGVAYQPISNASTQFFVTNVNTNATGYTSIAYSTYFGGANFNPPTGTTGPTAVGGGIAVDTNQNIYFTGTTNFTYTGCTGCGPTDFPILNAYQPCLDQPTTTNLVNPSCSYTTPPTAPDAFVAKLNPTAPGTQLLWSTYLGGTGNDSGVGIVLDTGATNVYIVGTTNSGDFVNPTTINTFSSFQKCLNNEPFSNVTTAVTCTAQTNPANDAFVARITNPTSTGTAVNVALNYFSYLGGAGNEAGTAITVDSNSGAVITGYTQSTFSAGSNGTFPLFPNPSSIGQSNLTGAQDAFVARLNTAAVLGQTTTASWATYYGGSVTNSGAASFTSGTGIALDVNQNTYLAGDTNSIDLLTAKPLQAKNAGTTGDTYDAFVAQLGTAVSLSIQGALSLGTNQTLVNAGTPVSFTYTITNNGPDLASNITIAADLSQSVTILPLTNISASISSGTCGGGGSTNTSISCGPVSLQSGSTATLTITATPTANSIGSSPEFFNGGTIQALAPGNIVLAQTSVPAEMSDFSMGVSPPNQNIPQAGATATYQVQITPHPLYNSSPITLSCTGFPTGSTCNFSPGTSITLQGASGSTATLSIPTTARPVTPTASLLRREFYAVWLMVPGIALFGIKGDRRRRRLLGLTILCVMLGLLLLLPACSHSTTQTPPSGTPAGNYTITVTASSGTDSKSQTITLNVP